MGETFARVTFYVVAVALLPLGIYLLTHPRFQEQFFDLENSWMSGRAESERLSEASSASS
jgi:hypothetical protein